MDILFCWLGNTDLRAASGELEIGQGPIASSLEEFEFDVIHILSNYSENKAKSFEKWISYKTKSNVKIHFIDLSSPTNFGEIYENAVKVITDETSLLKQDCNLTFHLSPGTPAMSAVWIILSKTRFAAQLIESSVEMGVKTVSLPFEISAEYLPDLLKKPDQKLIELNRGLPPEAPEFDQIIHRSAEMKRVIAQARWIAIRDVPVLIQGDSGTGKELIARAIHNSSARKNKAFIAVNCGAIPENLIESELFGYVRGAFTGADRTKKGYFEAANNGTLFLDEIGELSLMSQVRLLRVIQESQIIPLGSTKPVKIDMRIIAATNKNLSNEVSSDKFRTDLFHRIAVGILNLPALIDRKGDLGLLIDHFICQFNNELSSQPGCKKKNISTSAKKMLMQHNWPGNVRELCNTLLRIFTWNTGDRINKEDVKNSLLKIDVKKHDILNRAISADFDFRNVIDEVVRHYFSRALTETNGVKKKAAKLLGFKNYQTFNNWMTKHKVEES